MKKSTFECLRSFVSVALNGKFATVWWKKMTFKHVNNQRLILQASSMISYSLKNGENSFVFERTKTSFSKFWLRFAVSNVRVHDFVRAKAKKIAFDFGSFVRPGHLWFDFYHDLPEIFAVSSAVLVFLGGILSFWYETSTTTSKYLGTLLYSASLPTCASSTDHTSPTSKVTTLGRMN